MTEVADIVAVTPGMVSIQDFMKNTNMPYKWALAVFFSNLHAPAAVGFRHWDFTALFSNLPSIHRNIKDAISLNLPSMPETDKEIAKNRQKPAVYLTWLIESFTKKNDLILDPFLGSGNILLVSVLKYFLNLTVFGIKIRYHKIPLKKINLLHPVYI